MWHKIESGNENELNVIIEVPMGSRVKYELDKKTGMIKFDRVLYSPMHYPTNYGFVPRTYWHDEDPLDVLVFGYESLVPNCLVKVRPIGVLDMIDGGKSDIKILGVPIDDPRFKNINCLKDIEEHLLDEIKHFFRTYKDLQGKTVKVGEWSDNKKAKEMIIESIEMYAKKFPNLK